MIGECGCRCVCHKTEGTAAFPGPCAGCCEPGDACACGAVLLEYIRDVREDENWLGHELGGEA